MQFFVFWLNIINFSVDIKFIITRKYKKNCFRHKQTLLKFHIQKKCMH